MASRLRTRDDVDTDFLRDLKRNLQKDNGIHIYEIRNKKRIYDIDPDTGNYDGFVFRRDEEVIFDSKNITIRPTADDPATKKVDNEIVVRDALPFDLCQEIDEWQKENNWPESDEYYDPYSNIEMFIKYIAGEELGVEINYYRNSYKTISVAMTKKSADTFKSVNKYKYKNLYVKPLLLVDNNDMLQLVSIMKRIEI